MNIKNSRNGGEHDLSEWRCKKGHLLAKVNNRSSETRLITIKCRKCEKIYTLEVPQGRGHPT